MLQFIRMPDPHEEMSLLSNSNHSRQERPEDKVEPRQLRVWDLPTRLFHWLLVLCIVGLFVTGKIGGAMLPWHFRFGYVTGSLLLFRWVWGFVGGYHSRFGNFVRGWAGIRAYLKSGSSVTDMVGHNPLGALSVLAMLAILSLQVGLGLFADDRVAFSGPLSSMLNEKSVRLLTKIHKLIGNLLVPGLVSVHVLAIYGYWRFKKHNLVAPMWDGNQKAVQSAVGSRDDWRRRLLALLIWLMCFGLFVWIASRG